MGSLFGGSPSMPPPPPPPPPMANPPTFADATTSARALDTSAGRASSAFGGTITNTGGAGGLGEPGDSTRKSLLG